MHEVTMNAKYKMQSQQESMLYLAYIVLVACQLMHMNFNNVKLQFSAKHIDNDFLVT